MYGRYSEKPFKRADANCDHIRATLHRMHLKIAEQYAKRVWNLYSAYEDFYQATVLPKAFAEEANRGEAPKKGQLLAGMEPRMTSTPKD
jgi:hypothetical protein